MSSRFCGSDDQENFVISEADLPKHEEVVDKPGRYLVAFLKRSAMWLIFTLVVCTLYFGWDTVKNVAFWTIGSVACVLFCIYTYFFIRLSQFINHYDDDRPGLLMRLKLKIQYFFFGIEQRRVIALCFKLLIVALVLATIIVGVGYILYNAIFVHVF